MELMDNLGCRILEVVAKLGLNVANLGNVITFRKSAYGETIPDITLASEFIVFDLQLEGHGRLL